MERSSLPNCSGMQKQFTKIQMAMEMRRSENVSGFSWSSLQGSSLLFFFEPFQLVAFTPFKNAHPPGSFSLET